MYYQLKLLKRALPKVVVKGIQTAVRAVISDEKGQRKLLVEGYGLKDVMTTEGELDAAQCSDARQLMPTSSFARCHWHSHGDEPHHGDADGARHRVCAHGRVPRDRLHHVVARHEHRPAPRHAAGRRHDVQGGQSRGQHHAPQPSLTLSSLAQGEVLGITRFGVAKMKDSVLMLASFEKTTGASLRTVRALCQQPR